MDEIAPGLWRWTAQHPDWLADAEPDSPEGLSVDRQQLRELLTGLLALPIERVLVSHGEPVLAGAKAAVRACLSTTRRPFSLISYKYWVREVAK